MSWMQWMGDCIHVFTATDHQKNRLKNLIVWCITDCASSYISVWTDDRIILFECIQNMNFFMLLGNHFLCFQHFSLSFFFPKCRNWGAHYTRVHTIWYINAGLLEKEKTRLFQASIHWGTVRSKIHYFFYWGMNIFFSVYRKSAWKVLFVLFWSTKLSATIIPNFQTESMTCLYFSSPYLFCISCACSFPVKVEKILLKDHTNLGFPMWLIFQ